MKLQSIIYPLLLPLLIGCNSGEQEASPDNIEAEFAIVVRSDLKRQGLGRLLLEKMIRYCRSRGTRAIVGDVLRDNEAMLGLAEDVGFRRVHSDETEIRRVRLELEHQPTAAPALAGSTDPGSA